MGNILCKNRTTKNSATGTKSPVDRVIRQCQQICPPGIGKKKHFWEKQILETSPAPQSAATGSNQLLSGGKDGWASPTLSAVPNNNEKNTKPIAPPRKKRPSMLNKDGKPIKNGFGDVFSGDNDEKENQQNSINHQNASNSDLDQSHSDQVHEIHLSNSINLNLKNDDGVNNSKLVSSLTRKVSAVGNKKSDKFFGENLSDYLSDEIIPTDSSANNIDKNIQIKVDEFSTPKPTLTPVAVPTTIPEIPTVVQVELSKSTDKDKDETDNNVIAFQLPEIPTIQVDLSKSLEVDEIESSVIDVDGIEEELIRNINKEKGKLLFSLEKQLGPNKADEEKYKDEQPVEEELIVPVKKIRRHICDDDDKMHDTMHSHEHHDDHQSGNPSAPKKPQRDFAKYRKSLDRKEIAESSQIINGLSNEEELVWNLNTQETGKPKDQTVDLMVSDSIVISNDITDKVTKEAEAAVDEILKSAQILVTQKQEQTNRKNVSENVTLKETKIELNPPVVAALVVGKESIQKVKDLSSADPIDDTKSYLIQKIENFENVENVKTTKQEETPEKNLKSIEVEELTKTIEPDSLQIIQTPSRPQRSSEVVPPNLSNSEKILRRCLSTQSYLSTDLIEKIALQANILSMPESFSPEDALRCNDGSGLVSPNFKLDQKRSLSSQISYTSDKNDSVTLPSDEMTAENQNFLVIEQLIEANPTVPIEEIQKNDLHLISKAIPIQIADLPINKIEKQQSNRSVLKRLSSTTNDNSTTNLDAAGDTKKQVSDTIKNFLNKKDLNPKEILDLLQYEFGDYICAQNLSAEDQLMIADLQNAVTNAQNDEVITPTQEKSSMKFTRSVVMSKDKEKSPSKSPEKHKISKIPVFKNKSTETLVFNEKRRHSIDDLNAWFSPEKDFPIRKRKREASLPGCLNSPDALNSKLKESAIPTKKSILIEQVVNEENNEKSIDSMVDSILNKAESVVNSGLAAATKEDINSLKKKSHDFRNKRKQSKEAKLLLNTSQDNKTKKHANSNNHHSDSDEDDHSALLKFLEHEKTNN